MSSCNNDELANYVLAREEEYARTGNAVDFLEMMADFKNEFERQTYEYYHQPKKTYAIVSLVHQTFSTSIIETIQKETIKT